MICFSDSTEHGPAMTMNSSPPISTPLTRMRVLSCAKFLADEFVRRGDAHRFFDLRHGFDGLQARSDIADADDSDHDALLAFDRVHLVAKVFRDAANFVDFLPGGMQLHRDDHVLFLLPLG